MRSSFSVDVRNPFSKKNFAMGRVVLVALTRRRLGAILITGAVLVGMVAPLGALGADAPRPFIEQIGELERFPADARAALGSELVPEYASLGPGQFVQKDVLGTAIAVPEARQLWQFYPHPGQIRTGVVVRDLDTLAIRKTLVFGDRFDRATTTQGGDWSHAVDAAGTRLFLAGCTCTQSDRHTLVYEVDLRTFTVKKRPALASVDPSPTGSGNLFIVGGMTYDPFTDELLLLHGGPSSSSSANMSVFLYRMDVSGTPVDFDPEKLYKLRSCTGPLGSTEGGDDTLDWEILVTEDNLYVPCMRSGHTVIVVRTPRPEGDSRTWATHPEDFVAGPVYGETVMADQAGGRLFAVALTGQEVWAFEAATMAFVGVVAGGPAGTTDPTGYGLDRATGRVFFQSPTFGLGVVEGRFFPLPQARTHPRRARGQERILSDGATGRALVLEGSSAGSTKSTAYRVYRVDPAPVPPPPPDPDRNTADVPERDGVTEARFNASGSGYGTRVLWARGYATVVPAPALGSNAPTTGAADQFKSFCGYIDRDVFAGRVARAEYDTGSTAAAAIAVDVDGNTKQDLNQPSRCRASFLSEAQRWGYTPAACSSSAGSPRHEEAGAAGIAGDRALGTAAAKCPAPGGVLVAEAETALTGLGVEVQRSRTVTTVQRSPGGGVRSTVESVAQGVSLDIAGLGTVSFGEIRSRAVSESNGRPKRKEMSDHDIEISHVRVGGQVLCELKPACNPAELEKNLNTLAGSRAVFRTGHGDNSGRDKALVEGSRRGAQTAVQKSTARQASDRALVGDFTVEVPALEVTVYNDSPSWGRARQIYQFAGVASSATYNIVVLPKDVEFIDDEGPSDFYGTGDQSPEGSFDPLFAFADQSSNNGSPPTGNVIIRAIRRAADAVAKGMRLFLTNPRQFLLLLTAWGLFSLPPILSRRRRLLGIARSA